MLEIKAGKDVIYWVIYDNDVVHEGETIPGTVTNSKATRQALQDVKRDDLITKLEPIKDRFVGKETGYTVDKDGKIKYIDPDSVLTATAKVEKKIISR